MKKVVRLTEQDLVRLVKRVIQEQIERTLRSDLKPTDILNVVDRKGKESQIVVVKTDFAYMNEFIGRTNTNQKQRFIYGPYGNQITKYESPMDEYDFTISSVNIDGREFPVDKEGNF